MSSFQVCTGRGGVQPAHPTRGLQHPLRNAQSYTPTWALTLASPQGRNVAVSSRLTRYAKFIF